jgi:hypothetical protein
VWGILICLNPIAYLRRKPLENWCKLHKIFWNIVLNCLYSSISGFVGVKSNKSGNRAKTSQNGAKMKKLSKAHRHATRGGTYTRRVEARVIITLANVTRRVLTYYHHLRAAFRSPLTSAGNLKFKRNSTQHALVQLSRDFVHWPLYATRRSPCTRRVAIRFSL